VLYSVLSRQRSGRPIRAPPEASALLPLAQTDGRGDVRAEAGSDSGGSAAPAAPATKGK